MADARDPRDPDHEPDSGEVDPLAGIEEDLRDPMDPELDAMADALEDEPDVGQDTLARPLPRALLIPALALIAAAAAPLHPEGYSFLELLYVAFLRHPIEGVVMLLGFGAPFCFGVLVAASAWLDGRSKPEIDLGTTMGGIGLVRRAMIANLSLLHAQLVLVAVLVWQGGGAMMPLALLGFSLVAGVYFVVHHARAAAEGGVGTDRGDGPSLRWLIRWGATVLVATCGWIRLQVLVDVQLGWAVELILASCMAITVLVTRRR